MATATLTRPFSNDTSSRMPRIVNWLVHVPVAGVMASLLWYLPISRPLVLVWSGLIAITGVRLSRESSGELSGWTAGTDILAYLTSGHVGLAVLAALWSVTISTIVSLSSQEDRAFREAMDANLESARIDELTGLLGRNAFDDEIQAIVDSGEPHALAIIDLDRFKVINDTLGHAFGDAVLRAVGDRLLHVLPDGVIAGRRGGDEFAVLIPTNSERALRGMLHRTVDRIAEPIRHQGHTMQVEASAGVTVFSSTATAEQVLVEADLAMYRGKRTIGSRVTVFDQKMADDASHRADLERRLRTALENDDIVFWGQPITRVSDGSPIGLELLARWPQPDGSLISPLEFIPVAEETGLINDLGRRALAAAAKLLTQFANHPELATVRVNVNISPIHVAAGLERDVLATVRRIPDPTMLGLEFVETGLIGQAEANNSVLQNLRDLGVRVVIDDFGVGYSSLTYLRTFPISDLKIDRSFIDGIHQNRTQQVLTHAIWQMTNELSIPVVAEGVETDEDLEMIQALGIHAAQGYGIARPEPLGEAVHTLRRLARKSNRRHNEALSELRQVVHDLRSSDPATIDLRDGAPRSA